MQNKKAAAPSKKAQPPDCRFTWERDVLQRGLDVVMRGAVTNNCFHQGERPQSDLAQDLGRLDTYRVHAVDAEQDQTCDTTAQNVIVPNQTSYIILRVLDPKFSTQRGVFRSPHPYYTAISI